jgi:hypothetical protein
MEVILLLMWFVLWGGACAIVASHKNRSVIGWFALGFFFSFLALIVLALIPPLGESVQVTAPAVATATGSEMKTCPHCAEPIRAAAAVCRYCGRECEAI